MGMGSLFFFHLIYTGPGAEGAYNSEMLVGTYPEALIKACSLQPKDQERARLVRQHFKTIIALLQSNTMEKTSSFPQPQQQRVGAGRGGGGGQRPPISMLEYLRSQAESLDLHSWEEGGRPSPSCQVETMWGNQTSSLTCSKEVRLP